MTLSRTRPLPRACKSFSDPKFARLVFNNKKRKPWLPLFISAPAVIVIALGLRHAGAAQRSIGERTGVPPQCRAGHGIFPRHLPERRAGKESTAAYLSGRRWHAVPAAGASAVPRSDAAQTVDVALDG